MSIKDDEQGYYTCGRCHTRQYFLKSSGPDEVVPCTVCGYLGKSQDHVLLPSQVKLNLSNY